MTFDHAVQWAADIKSYTADRLMPPWPVTDGIPLANDLALKPEEIERIGRRVDEGCPRGDPADAPPPLAFANPDEWQAGRPPPGRSGPTQRRPPCIVPEITLHAKAIRGALRPCN